MVRRFVSFWKKSFEMEKKDVIKMLQSSIDEEIEIITHNLQQNLREKEKEKHKFAILKYGNDLCHKLVAGHVPLNLTLNSKGLFKFPQISYSILLFFHCPLIRKKF